VSYSKGDQQFALETLMAAHPTSGKTLSVNNIENPNDDGCVLGTAGRDEDPNATTDWDHDSDADLAPEDARGLPGYPSHSDDDQLHSIPSKRQLDDEPGGSTDTPPQDNDSAD
jgi:hypothetical protein